MTDRPVRLAVVVAMLALFAVGACGGDDTTSTETPRGSVAPAVDTEILLGGIVTEQELDVVRDQYDLARQRWDEHGLTEYRLVVQLQTVVTVTVDHVDGVPVSETVTLISNGATSEMADSLQRSVDEVFAAIEERLLAFEADPSSVPAPGDCGAHLNVSFDTDLGHPSYYDGLGPCDDGVGVHVQVIRN